MFGVTEKFSFSIASSAFKLLIKSKEETKKHTLTQLYWVGENCRQKKIPTTTINCYKNTQQKKVENEIRPIEIIVIIVLMKVC